MQTIGEAEREEEKKQQAPVNSGCCGDDDERAIRTVLRDAKQRGDMNNLVSGVGRDKLTWKIDGDNNDELHTIGGN